MKALTIHHHAANGRDFCGGIEGEIAIPTMLVCDNPNCGCDRAHTGLNTARSSTTIMVRDVELTFDDLVTAVAGFIETGWPDEPESSAHDIAAANTEIAEHYPVGTVLRTTFDRDTDEWQYTPM
jgi:hypothetical protein